MKTKALAIDEIWVTPQRLKFTCHGLGSCVGVFVADNRKQIFAAAHLAWQTSESRTIARLDAMLEKMKQLGSSLEGLRTKITGGGSQLNLDPNLGEKNSMTILNYMIRHRVYIAACDTGGTQARKACFSCDTGELQITYGNTQTIII
jgi:chemotaxis protein CheD